MSDEAKRFIEQRKTAYCVTFGAETPNVAAVLDDLRRFCRASGTPLAVSKVTGTVDPIATGVAIGRLEVWLRILTHLTMSVEELAELFGAVSDNENS